MKPIAPGTNETFDEVVIIDLLMTDNNGSELRGPVPKLKQDLPKVAFHVGRTCIHQDGKLSLQG